MQWSDEGIVLSLRAHGETSAILEALTGEHGRHLGLVRGGASSKIRAVLQPGNKVRLTWRARISENLGVFAVEPVKARAHALFESRAGLAGLNALTGVASAVLPEREPHTPAYEGADALLDAIAGHDFADWAPLYVRWEAGLLDELGFGLDLSRCAATGATDDLIYVSPRTGRAVSAQSGAPYREKLLALPAFLLDGAAQPSAVDVLAGLNLTFYFLENRVLAPHGRTLPDARRRLAELAARRSAESA